MNTGATVQESVRVVPMEFVCGGGEVVARWCVRDSIGSIEDVHRYSRL